MKIPAANQVSPSHYVELCPQLLPLFRPGKCSRPSDAIETKMLLEFLRFELMIYLNNLESCVNCVWWTLSRRTSRMPIDPVSRLFSWCTAVSGSPDSTSRTGSQGHLRECEREGRLEPQKASRKPLGSHTHTTAVHLRAAGATPYRQQFDLLFTLNIFFLL